MSAASVAERSINVQTRRIKDRRARSPKNSPKLCSLPRTANGRLRLRQLVISSLTSNILPHYCFIQPDE